MPNNNGKIKYSREWDYFTETSKLASGRIRKRQTEEELMKKGVKNVKNFIV